MKKTEYRLDEQIRQAVFSLETKWTEKEIGFQVELEEVKYTGNEGLFMHIWINLLDNAIKFSPSKGTITMFLKQMCIRDRFRSSFHLKQKEIDYINEKGLDTIRQHAADFIAKREAPAYIANDGKQTPMRGHPVSVSYTHLECV